jgi:hypothetical protein
MAQHLHIDEGAIPTTGGFRRQCAATGQAPAQLLRRYIPAGRNSCFVTKFCFVLGLLPGKALLECTAVRSLGQAKVKHFKGERGCRGCLCQATACLCQAMGCLCQATGCFCHVTGCLCQATGCLCQATGCLCQAMVNVFKGDRGCRYSRFLF